MEASSSLSLAIARASYPEPFAASLEFNAPVRGPWNIVHMALLIPEAHLIYLCARGCLRGVLMTAAEMGAMERMSWVGVSEEDLSRGTLEEVSLAAITSIVEKLPKRPPLILLYLSCIHKFTQFDYPRLITELTKRFPTITFVDCHMMPTMRKSGPTDEERTRAKIFQALYTRQPKPLRPEYINLLGYDRPIDTESRLLTLLQQGGKKVWQLASLQSFADYLAMGESATNLLLTPQVRLAGQICAEHLGQKALPCLVSFDLQEIAKTLTSVGQALDLPLPKDGFAKDMEECAKALKKTQAILGKRPIAIDYTATPRPLSLARLLLDFGFAVETVFLDAISADEKEDFLFLQKNAPTLVLHQTLAPRLRLRSERLRSLQRSPDEILAIGQKAAYLAETDFFVDLVGGGSLFDFAGIQSLANLLTDAHTTPKARPRLLQQKGQGCPTLLTPNNAILHP